MPAHRHALITGTLYALAAGLMWGLVFVAPIMLAEYPAALLSASRYLAFGLIALPLAWWDRAALRALAGADWLEALKLSAVGNLLYYACLAAAIQRAGAPMPTMVIGTLPVVIAVTANLRIGSSEARLPWMRMLPSLLLIATGLAAVNQVEMSQLTAQTDLWRYASGALLAVGAVACWTWYPIRNGEWLRAHADRSPRVWATAQGLVTLPVSALGFALFWAWTTWAGDPPFDMPLGPQPARFVGLMLALGLLASWLGTLCWNEASQRLPPALAGQLIVFETLAALAYAFAWRGEVPHGITLLGAALLVAGVVMALRSRAPAPAA
jgi:drug/metabolite transporter (DMT)-like permease